MRAAVEAMATEAARRGAAAVRALQRGLDLGIDASARVGADAFGPVAASEDVREGTRAFLEKRPPRLEGA